MAKPTEDLNFGESSTNIAEPSSVRAGGYPFKAPLPSNFLNWSLRALGRAGTWLLDLFDDDGALTLGALYGKIELIADPANTGAGLFHVYRHTADGSGVASQFRADSIRGESSLVAGEYAVIAPDADTADLAVTQHQHSGSGIAEFRSGSFAPLRSVPGDASLSRATALYLDNLLKTSVAISVSWNGSGVPSVSIVTGYNATGVAIVAPTGAFLLNGLRVNTIDDYTPREPMVDVTPPTSLLNTPFLVYVTQLVGPTTRWHITLLADLGAGFVDVLATTAGLAGTTATIKLRSN